MGVHPVELGEEFRQQLGKLESGDKEQILEVLRAIEEQGPQRLVPLQFIDLAAGMQEKISPALRVRLLIGEAHLATTKAGNWRLFFLRIREKTSVLFLVRRPELRLSEGP